MDAERLAQMRATQAEYQARETTITLTNEEWHTIIAAMYRAVMDDASDLLAADELELDTDRQLNLIARTVSTRTKVHQALHAGNADQATWSAPEEEDH